MLWRCTLLFVVLAFALPACNKVKHTGPTYEGKQASQWVDDIRSETNPELHRPAARALALICKNSEESLIVLTPPLQYAAVKDEDKLTRYWASVGLVHCALGKGVPIPIGVIAKPG